MYCEHRPHRCTSPRFPTITFGIALDSEHRPIRLAVHRPIRAPRLVKPLRNQAKCVEAWPAKSLDLCHVSTGGECQLAPCNCRCLEPRLVQLAVHTFEPCPLSATDRTTSGSSFFGGVRARRYVLAKGGDFLSAEHDTSPTAIDLTLQLSSASLSSRSRCTFVFTTYLETPTPHRTSVLCLLSMPIHTWRHLTSASGIAQMRFYCINARVSTNI
jgi:hypothetical protein